MSVTPGARFGQTQPVAAFSIGGQGPGNSPVTLLTVPPGKTYTLKHAHLSLAIGTSSGFVSASGAGVNAYITDSLGNVYLDVEAFCFQPSQQSQNAISVPCYDAVLPAGTVITMVMGAVPANVGARMGGGVLWSPS